jgi:hypothetical protein
LTLFLDSFWRAVAYCLHPRVIALSFLPLVVMVVLSLGLGYFYWDASLEWVRGLLESSDLLKSVWAWLQGVGAGNLKTVAAPLIVIFTLTPLIVLLSLLLVATFMGPALSALVAERRFPHLERKRGGSLVTSIAWSLGSTVLALLALVISCTVLAGAPADPDFAAADLGLVDLPRDGFRCAIGACQQGGAARGLSQAPALAARNRRADGLSRGRSQHRLGFRRLVRGGLS